MRSPSQFDVAPSRGAACHDALEKALADAARESDEILTLKLRAQVDDQTFERRRLQILDRQARLRIHLDEPTPSPDELMGRVQKVLRFSTSLPQAFQEGDSVRRRTIFHAICANPVVRDRKALYQAKEPWSFFEDAGLIRSWCTILERLRTWIVEHDFQIPPIFEATDPMEERYRRTGTVTRWARNQSDDSRVPQRHMAA